MSSELQRLQWRLNQQSRRACAPGHWRNGRYVPEPTPPLSQTPAAIAMRKHRRKIRGAS